MALLLYLIIHSFLPLLAFAVLDCLEHVSLTRYFKVKSCRKSTQRIIGAANFANLSDCEKYARQRKALAFNFSPVASSFIEREIGYAANCQLLGCPQIGNSSDLVKDTNYDYYSVFGNVSGKHYNNYYTHVESVEIGAISRDSTRRYLLTSCFC